MTRISQKILPVFLAAALAAGCVTVKKEGPSLPAAKPALSRAQKTLQDKKSKRLSNNVPPVLGGIVKSDSWVIYKDKEQEEFKGNVAYDNDAYKFRSDYALSDRKKGSFSASGRVYLKQTGEKGSFYEAQADRGHYNYNTQKGALYADKGKRLKLVYRDEQGDVSTARAQKADFDLNKKLYNLYGNVVITRPSPKGLVTLKAQKVNADQLAEKAVLEGDAQLTTPDYSLTAQTIVFDGKNNHSYAYGSRPLARGKTEQGTFAIIADKAQAENESRKIVMNGNVQGWLVSDEINKADVNDKF